MRVALAQVYPKNTWVSDDYGKRIDFSHFGEFSQLEEVDEQQLYKLKQFVDYQNAHNKNFTYIIVLETQKTVQVAIDEVIARHQKEAEEQQKRQAEYDKQTKEREKKAKQKKLAAAKKLLREAGELP